MRPRDVVAIAFAVSTVTALGLIAALAVVVPRLVESEQERVVRLAVACLESVEVERAWLTPAAGIADVNR